MQLLYYLTGGLVPVCAYYFAFTGKSGDFARGASVQTARVGITSNSVVAAPLSATVVQCRQYTQCEQALVHQPSRICIQHAVIEAVVLEIK